MAFQVLIIPTYFVVRCTFKSSPLTYVCLHLIVSLWVKIKTNSSKFIYLGVIYRHPNQQFDNFEKDLYGLLTNFNLNNNEYIITGDFNIDLLNLV